MTQSSSRARAKSKARPAGATRSRSAKERQTAATEAAAKPGATNPDTGITARAWTRPAPANLLPGFAFGLPYPSAVFPCVVPPTTPEERSELARRFDSLFEGADGLATLPAFADPASGSALEDSAAWFAALMSRMQTLAGLPVTASPRAVRGGEAAVTFAVPALSRGLRPTVNLIELACEAFGRGHEASLDDLRARAHAAFASLKASALLTSNTPRFVRAAVQNGIAFQEHAGSMVQYGIGCKSMLMDSSFTQDCSNVGARLAKYKGLCAAFLRRAGLPAPLNAVAQSEEQALEIARQLGFPVVIKPADKDGGLAVQADLRDEADVRWAFPRVREVTKSVLVEEFYPGNDYRVLVFRGKAIWAKERRPAGVTGDGTSTIRELVAAINADPRRGSDVYAALKTIALDEDAANLLARDGLTFDSVPEEGTFVRLRRRANVSSGGLPVPVTDRMHPDNARLAERAAELVGLDLAGIDLIMPDIARSWREDRSTICEINAQPELGSDGEHLYQEVLQALVDGTGHIPTIAILGGNKADALAAKLAEALNLQGCRTGLHDRSGVRVGGETIVSGDLQPLKAGRMLTMDRRVEALVLGALDSRVLAQGLPVLQIDMLLLTGDLPPPLQLPDGVRPRRIWTDALRLLLPHCRAVTALGPLDTFDPELRAPLSQVARLDQVESESEQMALLGRLVRAVAASVEQGRRST